MDETSPAAKPMDVQTADALLALAASLCMQEGINGQKLRIDFLARLERLAGSPERVGEVGKTIAALMDAVLRSEHIRPGLSE